MNSEAGVTSAQTVSEYTNAREPAVFPYFPGTNISAKDGI